MQLPDDREATTSTPAEAIEAARSDGILNPTVGESMARAFSSLTSVDDIKNGFDDHDIAGGLAAANGGAGAGAFGSSRLTLGPDGWGRSGFGVGCGDADGGAKDPCSGWGTVKTGRYGTINYSQLAGYGKAGGVSLPGLHGRDGNVPGVTAGAANLIGDYDKAIIRRYLHRNFAKIQYCYDRERLQRPQLEGEIELDFVLDAHGHVVSSRATGFDDRVGGCVADVVAHIEFPAVKDGGLTEVRYPLWFRPR
jgi:hypothetical protein